MKCNLKDFVGMIAETRAEEEAMDVVVKIVLEASTNNALVEEAVEYINAKLNWAAAIEKTVTHSELG